VRAVDTKYAAHVQRRAHEARDERGGDQRLTHVRIEVCVVQRGIDCVVDVRMRKLRWRGHDDE